MTSMTMMLATLLSVVLISPPLSERFCTLSPVEGLSCKPIVHGLKIKVTYKNRLLHIIRKRKNKKQANHCVCLETNEISHSLILDRLLAHCLADLDK